MTSSKVPWISSHHDLLPKNNSKCDPPLPSFQNSMSLCVCVRLCECMPTAVTHLSPLIPAYIFITGHAIMLVSSSAGQGTFVSSLCESLVTSLHVYSCDVNNWSSTLMPQAKNDITTAIFCFWFLLHILIIAIFFLITVKQDPC